MIDTDKYMYEEEAKKIVQDAGLIDECDGFLDVHYKSIAHLLAEVKRLREQLIQAEDWVWVEGRHRFETSEDRLKHYKEYIGDDEE